MRIELSKPPKQAVSSPLLEASIMGATNAIINVTGGTGLTLFEVEDAAEVVRSAANTDINVIFGAVINESFNDEVVVTIIATGFEQIGDSLLAKVTVPEPERIVEELESELDIPPFLRRNKFEE